MRNVDKKQILLVLMIISTYLIGELHTLWKNDPRVQNWIIYAYKPMTIAWNVKYLGEEINRVVEALFFYLSISYALNWMNKKVIGAKDFFVTIRFAFLEYFIYRIIDIVWYFLNYKTQNYWYVFLIVSVIMAIRWKMHYVVIARTTKNNKRIT